MNTGVCVHTLLGHTTCVMSIVYDGVHIVSTDENSEWRVWNARTGVCVRVIDANEYTLCMHRMRLCALADRQRVFIVSHHGGYTPSTIRVYDVHAGAPAYAPIDSAESGYLLLILKSVKMLYF
jgi:WD40 repeat protein